MPLIQGKSKKTFGKNVEKEMDAGKPQKQSLAIAFAVQRKNKKPTKKMAKGGMINNVEGFDDAQKDRNPGTPARKADNMAMLKENYANENWTGSEKLDDKASTSMTIPKSQYDGEKWAEGGQIADNKISPAQKAAYHRLEAEKYQRMADGGMINDEVSQSAAENEGYDNVKFPPAKKDDQRLPEAQYMSGQWADGGMINDDEPFADAEYDREDSVVDAIRKKKMAHGGSVDSNDEEEGQTPYAEMNGEAYQNGEYDPDQLSPQPTDSNLKGDQREDDSENINDSSTVGKIRKKLKAKRD